MKKAILLVLMLTAAGCATPEEGAAEFKLYESARTFSGQPPFATGDWDENAEIAPFDRQRLNYNFGPERVIRGTIERATHISTPEHPEGREVTIRYNPGHAVISFTFENGTEGVPGFQYGFLAIELPDVRVAPGKKDEKPKPRVFMVDPRKGRCPRAVFYRKHLLPASTGGRFYPSDFYSEKAYGKVTLLGRGRQYLEGEVDLTFHPNMLNELGFENHGSDMPDGRDFTIKGHFVVPRFGYAESKK